MIVYTNTWFLYINLKNGDLSWNYTKNEQNAGFHFGEKTLISGPFAFVYRMPHFNIWKQGVGIKSSLFDFLNLFSQPAISNPPHK